MLPTRPSRLGLLIPMTLAILLGPPSVGRAQVPKTGTVPPAAKAKGKADEPARPREPVDLNTATAEELEALPGIGPANARKIIEGRPHKAVADLAQSGIPSTTVDKLGPLVVVRPLPPAVDINLDPVEKLETLPGVGPALSREIVAGRPFSKYDDLAKVKGFGPKKIDDLRGRLKFGKAEPAMRKVEPPAKKAEPARERATKAASAPTAKAAPGARVNLNTASKEELDTLPGIGPSLSQAIIDARPFARVEDVMKVKGIKEAKFGEIKDRITVK